MDLAQRDDKLYQSSVEVRKQGEPEQKVKI